MSSRELLRFRSVRGGVAILVASLCGADAPPDPPLLQTGQTVTLRIRQVFPADGLSPGERLLNSRSPIQAGDRFLAEILEPHCPHPPLVGGRVTRVKPSGCFGRPGYVTLELSQLVQMGDGQTRMIPWQVDLEDRGFPARLRRVILSTLLGAEGAALGATFGAQFANGNDMAWLGGFAGAGLVLGVAYATLQRGVDPHLEPGDTFHAVVGNLSCKPVPRDWQTVLYPAGDPDGRRRKGK